MSESEIYVGIFGTGVGRASVKQLERHWDRDLSIISRLNSTYTPDRDILAQQLRRECNETVTLRCNNDIAVNPWRSYVATTVLFVLLTCCLGRWNMPWILLRLQDRSI